MSLHLLACFNANSTAAHVCVYWASNIHRKTCPNLNISLNVGLKYRSPDLERESLVFCIIYCAFFFVLLLYSIISFICFLLHQVVRAEWWCRRTESCPPCVVFGKTQKDRRLLLLHAPLTRLKSFVFAVNHLHPLNKHPRQRQLNIRHRWLIFVLCAPTSYVFRIVPLRKVL